MQISTPNGDSSEAANRGGIVLVVPATQSKVRPSEANVQKVPEWRLALRLWASRAYQMVWWSMQTPALMWASR
jgi:hypothetical protein